MENFNNEKVNNFQYKKQQSIYFIYSQIKNNILQIQFKPKNENFNINELNLKYNQKNIINAKNENIINTIFEISFSLQKSLLKFYLEMNTIDKNRFISQEEYSIKKDKDLFIFNLEFKGYENYLLYFNTSEKKQLSMKEQFEIFNNYLKEKINKKIENVSIKEILINDTIAILNKNKNNFDFDLFLCLFREIYFCGTLKKLLSVFDMKKININNNIDFKQFEIIFKILLKKPIFLLNNLEWNENIEKKFYDVSILFFKLFEQKFLEKLLFPDLNEIKKENEKNYLKKRSKMMINTILKNPEKFSGLNNEKMKKLLDSTQDKKEKLKLIFFTKKLEIKLFIINETLEIIKNKIEIDQNSLDYNSEDDINKIFDYFYKILTYAQKINFNGIFVDIKEEVWENYSDEYYKSKKIKYLYLLRKNISKINNKKIIDKIDFYIDNLGFYFIDKKMIKNRLLLDFFNNDKILFIKISKEKIDKIAKCINLNSINEKDFIIEFKNFKFKNLFKNYYEYFLQKIFSNFETINLFYNIFKIYSPEDKIDIEIIHEMYNRFIALLKLDSNVNDSIYFNEIVKFFLKFLKFFKFKNFNSKKLFDDINSNNNLKKEKLADLYNYLLTTNLIDNKIFIYENFFKYSENPVVIEMKNIANNINNKNNLKNLMEKLNNKIINEQDFLLKNSENFYFLKFIVDFELFWEKFQYLKDTTYIKMTKIKIEDILNKYRSCSFTISEAYQLNEMNDLNEKIRILYLNKDFDADLFYKTLKEKINEAINTKKIIDSVQNCINIFFRKNEEFTNKINDLSKKISQVEINKLKNFEKDINEYKKMAKDAIKANECSKCEFFMNIFRINSKTKKNLNEKELIKQSLKDFDGLIDLLDIKTINNIPMRKLNIILSSKFSKDLIKKQFDFLKDYFDKKVDTTEIETFINIFSKRMTILNSVNNIKKLFKLFNITNTTEYSENINNFKIYERFEKINDVIEMVKILKNNNINIEENSIAFDILNKLFFFEKNGLSEFLLDKKEEDIQNLINFVDNIYLKATDIQDLMKTVAFFNELKKYNKEKDSIFMDKFYELSKSDKYKNIENYIENICKNFTSIRDLYIKIVNKSQNTKEKVK